ncbi:hypothetical protein GGR52DRAFT_522953 [Hypoxylon sp. FL1284]|nr:hypothetical protein GGR52DRAFT_522953 [Hypoxylon sp. FL1284]
MYTFAILTGALAGTAQQVHTALFGADHSPVAGSVVPDNSTVGIFHSQVINTHDVLTTSVPGVITHVVVSMTGTDNETSQRMVDSGVEIDTVMSAASVRRVDITDEIQTTTATPAAIGQPSAPFAETTDGADAALTEHQAEL